jgi:hypothetical protein
MLSNPHYDPNQASLDEFEEEIDLEDVGDLSEDEISEMREFVHLAREEQDFEDAISDTEERQCLNCHDFFEIPIVDSDIDITDLCEYCEDESEEQWS